MSKLPYIFLALLSGFSAAAQLKISTPVPVDFLPQTDSFLQFTSLIKRSGFTPQFQFLPLRRSLRELNRGNIDGAFTVYNDMLHQFDNIIMVDGAVSKARIVAFYRAGNIDEINSLDDLKEYDVGFLRWWNEWEKIASHGKTHAGVREQTVLMNMLMANRFDVIIMEQSVGEFVRQALEIPASQLASSKVLAEFPVYLLLHKKHTVLRDSLGLGRTQQLAE